MDQSTRQRRASGPIRWSGVALALSGVLLVLVAALHPNIFHTGFVHAALHSRSWVTLHLFTVAAMVLLLFGVAGLYAAQASRLGKLGAAGAFIAVPGIVVIACAAYLEAAVMPTLATDAPHLLDWDGPLLGSTLLRATAAATAACPIGLLLLGSATLRAGVLPRPAAAAFTLGALTFSILEALFVPILGVASTALYAAGCGWLGHAIWSRPPPATLDNAAAEVRSGAA